MPLKPEAFDPDDDFEGPDSDDVLAEVDIDLDAADDDHDGEDDDQPKRRDDRDDDGRRKTTKKRDDDEDDDEGYSSRVRKRIAKLRAQKGESDRELESTRAELARVRAEASRATSHAIDSSVSTLKQKREDLRAKLAEAIENGDTKAQVDLQDDLADLRDRLRSAEFHRQKVKQADDDPEADGKDAKPRAPKVRKITQRFLDDIGFEEWSMADKAMLNAIDVSVHQDGDYTPDDPEYYEEMRSRMRKVRPELFDDDDEDDPPPRRSKRRTPASAGGRESGGRSERGNTVRITESEKRMMKMMRLDPSNPAHLREYAANKRSRVRAERANDDLE